MGETWRERLVRVVEAVPVAERERNETIAEALEAGCSTRAIGEAVGVPFTTIYRWAGKQGQRHGAEVLDEEVPDAA